MHQFLRIGSGVILCCIGKKLGMLTSSHQPNLTLLVISLSPHGTEKSRSDRRLAMRMPFIIGKIYPVSLIEA